MSLMLDRWTPAKAKKKLRTRLQNSREVRTSKLDAQWETNERTVYNTDGAVAGQISTTADGVPMTPEDGGDAPASSTGTNYTFKNLRFIHAQMSANPPATIPRPATSDPEDRRRARAADRVMRYALRQYGLQEKFDQTNLNCLLYGTGFIKTVWDSTKGDIVGFRRNGSLVMEGDISVRPVSPWKMYIDPDAEAWEDVRYVIEEITVSYEEAIYRWPKKKELIDKMLAGKDGGATAHAEHGGVVYSYLRGGSETKYESIKAYEYWETGMPSNAMLGRYAVHLEDGTMLEGPKPSPFAFSPPPSSLDLQRARKTGKPLKKAPPTARLPYHIITDIDVPARVWGKSFVEFEAPLQELLNQLDSLMLVNLQAHGVARLILPDGVDTAGPQITNSPWDIIRLKGDGGRGGEPKYMAPMQMPPAATELRNITKLGHDDMAGINESMFGQQSREQSGFSMQYAVNQGNLIRRRLFNKYVLLVESVYRAILDLVRKHWRDERTIQVLGKEKAFEVIDLKGADIDGGYDLVVEYGTSLSLDPMTRRQEIMAMMPLLKEAGIPPRVILSLLKLGELDVADDMIQMADDRQREIFEEMIATGVYMPPEELQEHEAMLAYGLRFVMTSEFKYLEPDEKLLIRKHIKDRATLAASEKAGGHADAGAAPGAPGPKPGMSQVPGQPASPAAATPPGVPSTPAGLGA